LNLDGQKTGGPADEAVPSSVSPGASEVRQSTSSGTNGSAEPNSNTPSSVAGVRLVRRAPPVQSGSPDSSRVSPGTTPSPAPASGRILSHAELCECLNKAIATTPAEMFLPETALDNVRRQLKCGPVIDGFAKSSVGEAMEAIVTILGSKGARPHGFDAAYPGEGSLPLVSAARLVRVVQELSESHEHFKKHATRTLLNLVADATTDGDQRLCASTLIGMLFRQGFYGDNDPYQVLVDVLSPYGRMANADIACAITRLITVSNCAVTPAANRLFALFRPAPPPDAGEFMRRGMAPSPSTTATHASGSATPGALSVTGETAKFAGDSSSGATAPPPPPYSASTSTMQSESLGPSSDVAKSQEESARRRTVYVTRVDPSMSEGELRTVLLECGDFNKVRLCGDTPGRCKYCFVEFASDAGARKMLKLDGRAFGTQQLRVGIAKNSIETNDPRDALFDNARGKVRACIFGLSMKPTPEGQSVRQLANSAPPTVGERAQQLDRRKRVDALTSSDISEKGVMGRGDQPHGDLKASTSTSEKTSKSTSASEPKDQPTA
jgi:hypothetical protein